MTADWREQLRIIPQAALIDMEKYAAELDAIDASTCKSVEAHGKKPEMSIFGWGDPVVEDSRVKRIVRRPITPIVGSDPARIAVALLQRVHLSRTTGQFGDTFQVLLAMADRLMKRKVPLSPETGRDLVQVVNAPALSDKHRQLFEYLFPTLKQLEHSFSPPIPEIMRSPLKALHSNLSRPIPKEKWERRKKSGAPKKYQNACRRIERLLEDG